MSFLINPSMSFPRSRLIPSEFILEIFALTFLSIENDFTTSSNKAFGNNLKLVGSKYCIYSGDVNQDGIIASQDLNSVFTDNTNGITGYTATDLNGDMYTESDDLIKVFMNNYLGVTRKKPQ